MTVKLVEGKCYDPAEIERDWEKLSEHLPRNGLLSCLTDEDPEKETYAYSERTVINPIVKGTVFERIIKDLMPLTRAVFVTIPPGMCLRQHNDPDNKYHLSINSSGACFFFDFDTMLGERIPANGQIYQVNSGEVHHSAINAGTESRVNLVMSRYYSKNNPTNKYRLWFDYSKCNFEIPGKGDLRTTVDQNFMMKYIQRIVQDGTAHEIYGSDDDCVRNYHIITNGELDLDDLLLFKVKHALSHFNIECNLVEDNF